jgi:hypothetical protein
MRRFFPFSIRDLLWLTLVVALGLGWWLSSRSDQSEKLSRRARALEKALQLSGWRVQYEPEDTEWLTVTREDGGEAQIRFYYGAFIGRTVKTAVPSQAEPGQSN